MEGLAQSTAKVPLGIRRRLIEPEGSRVSSLGDVRQPDEATGSFVVDTAAGMRVRNLGGHLRQPGQQERRNVVELFPEDGLPPELDQFWDGPGLCWLEEIIRVGLQMATQSLQAVVPAWERG
jgi:hypothetical protein